MSELAIYVQNHKSRDAGPIAAAIAHETGVSPMVFTDTSDYYLMKGKARFRGCLQNYFDLLSHAASSRADWIVAAQDDISIPAGLFERVRYVLERCPGGVVSFYAPSSRWTEQATARKRHVLESYMPRIVLCCYRRAVLDRFLEFGARHVLPAPVERSTTDDSWIWAALSRFQYPARTIMPSFAQHMGGFGPQKEVSVWPSHRFGEERGRPRYSSVYEPTFDVTSVDWSSEFARPLRRMTKWSAAGFVGL